MEKPHFGVLLVEDDEDDYILVRDLLAEVAHVEYTLQWAANRDQALRVMDAWSHDICLLDHRLGGEDGIELLREARDRGYRAPIIFLTGYGNLELDERALLAGAADFLNKAEISGPLLDRAIRYTIRQSRIQERLQAAEAKGRQLSIDLLSSQETERKRIAGELHDSIGQALAAMKFCVENGLEQISRGSTAEAMATLRRAVTMVREITEETRRIQTDLQPPMLYDLGIAETLNWFFLEYQKTYAGIRFESSIAVKEEEIPDALKATIFRIAREALHNIARHSKADRIQVSLGSDCEGLSLSIRDNGEGFDPEELKERPQGMGLPGMKGRTELSGGLFRIRTERGRGTSLSFTWPHFKLLQTPQADAEIPTGGAKA